MNRSKFFLVLFVGVVLLLSFLAITQNDSVQAQSGPVPVTGWAWSSNIGWIKMAGDKEGGSPWANSVSVDLDDGDVSGFGWSSNIGWIDFSNVQGQANGQITGSAEALSADGNGWDGEIRMSGNKTSGQPWANSVRVVDNQVTGFAWGGPVVGWVKFDNLFDPGDDPDNPECTGACIDHDPDDEEDQLRVTIHGDPTEAAGSLVIVSGFEAEPCDSFDLGGNGSSCLYDIPAGETVMITATVTNGLQLSWGGVCGLTGNSSGVTCEFTKDDGFEQADVFLNTQSSELFDINPTTCVNFGDDCLIVINCSGNACPLPALVVYPLGGVELRPLNSGQALSWTVEPDSLIYNDGGQVDIYFCPSTQFSGCTQGSLGPTNGPVYVFARLVNRQQISLTREVKIKATDSVSGASDEKAIKVRYIDSNIGQSFFPNR